jgi:hypothetical protein
MTPRFMIGLVIIAAVFAAVWYGLLPLAAQLLAVAR